MKQNLFVNSDKEAEAKIIEINKMLYSEDLKITENFIENGKSKINRKFFCSSINSEIELICKNLRELITNNDLEKNVNNNFDIAFCITTLFSIYIQLVKNFDECEEFNEGRNTIKRALNNLHKKIATFYPSFFATPFFRKKSTALIYANMKDLGLENIKTSDFPIIFEDLYPKGPYQRFLFLNLLGNKKIYEYVTSKGYLFDEDITDYIRKDTIDPDDKDYPIGVRALWRAFLYSAPYNFCDKENTEKPLKKDDRNKDLLRFFSVSDFIYLYKTGEMDFKYLQEYVSHINILDNAGYFLNKQESENLNQEEVKKRYFSGDEIVKIFKSSEYKKKEFYNSEFCIWQAYLDNVFSIENLRELEKIQQKSGKPYFNIEKVIEYYNSFRGHDLAKEIKFGQINEKAIKEYFTFETIVNLITSKSVNKDEVIEFINTDVRDFYANDNDDFEQNIINALKKQSSNEKDSYQEIINLYDRGVISLSNLITNNIPKDVFLSYYAQKMKNATELTDEKELKKAKELMYTLSDNGMVDIIDVIETLEEIDNCEDKQEDDYLDVVYLMTKNNELSLKLLIEFHNSDSKEDTTKTLLEKFNKGLLDEPTIKSLSCLLDYNFIKQLYNQGKLSFEVLKQIIDEEKAKEIDEQYDLLGKIKELEENGGVQGLELDDVTKSSTTHIKRKNHILKRKSGHRIDEDTKSIFFSELYNIDKSDGEADENPLILSVNAPVFKDFVLYAFPNLGLGILEGPDGATYVSRLKEVLEEADNPYSQKNIIGNSRTRKEFKMANESIVRKVVHSKNWALQILNQSSDLATKNGDFIRRAVSRNYENEQSRIKRVGKTARDIVEMYQENLRKSKIVGEN